MADKPNPAQDIKDAERPNKKPRTSKFWLAQLDIAGKEHKEFFDEAAKHEKRYLNERDHVRKSGTKRFQIVYANTETTMSALYARQAKPDVRQRFTAAKDKLARKVAEIVERALSFEQDTTEHDKVNRRAVKDMCLAGRGIVRVCYEPEMGEVDGQEVIVRQIIRDEHVYWKNFLHSPAESWSDVWWVGFRHYMTRSDLRDMEFMNPDDIPLDWCPDMGQKRDQDVPEDLKRAEVWEIWHKAKKERIWVVKGYPYVLRADDDPYGLEHFWPMAEPIQGVYANCSFVPRSPIVEYEDQIDDLDEITDRISRLTKALKRRGVYDQAIKELARLARANDNTFIPIENFGAFAQSGGFQGAFQVEDLSPTIAVLQGLYEQRAQLIETIYEVTGISDIMRGQSQASETATAQSIKAQFGSARIKERQQDVQRWIRDTMRIKAELIAEHMEPAQLMEMTGMDLPSEQQIMAEHAAMANQAMMMMQPPPPPPQLPPDMVTIEKVVQVLRSDKLRGYHVDIETDSTIFEDAAQEKQDRVELLTSMSSFMQNALPIAQMGGPPMQKLMMSMLEFGVRGFKGARAMEDALDEMKEELEQAAQQPPEPPPPDPAVEAENAKAQAIETKAKADIMTTEAKTTATLAAIDAKSQADELKTANDIRKMIADASLKDEGRPN